jgi:hypothetical protein
MGKHDGSDTCFRKHMYMIVCVCVCACVCLNACIVVRWESTMGVTPASTNTCILLCLCVRMCVCVEYIDACMHICIYTYSCCMFVDAEALTQRNDAYTYTYIHVHIQHTYIHTYIYTYTSTQRPSPRGMAHTHTHTYIYAYMHTYIPLLHVCRREGPHPGG